MMNQSILISMLIATLLIGQTSCAQDKMEKVKKEKSGKKGKRKASTPVSIPGLTFIGQLPAEIKESSGMAYAGSPGTYYTQGDAGTSSTLYKVDTNGNLLGKLNLSVPNHDWESLSHDKAGNVFLCDCGNNSNDRKDLVIYKVPASGSAKPGEIRFSYPDQTSFPPAKAERNFDSEASIWQGGRVYIFTRDRGRQKTSKVYSVPDVPGTYKAQREAILNVSGEVTSASLSPDEKTLVLLTKESIYVYEGESLAEILKAPPRQISTAGAGQTEASEFIDESTLIITTEEGNLYHYKLKG
jgi:hypothetical protein